MLAEMGSGLFTEWAAYFDVEAGRRAPRPAPQERQKSPQEVYALMRTWAVLSKDKPYTGKPARKRR